MDRWFHGDVAAGNLLLDDGQLAAVIDFGTCGVGDPACDLAVAWTLLTADGRQAFRERLSVDEATWARGRGWALWKTLATCSLHHEIPRTRRTSRARCAPSTRSSPSTRASDLGALTWTDPWGVLTSWCSPTEIHTTSMPSGPSAGSIFGGRQSARSTTHTPQAFSRVAADMNQSSWLHWMRVTAL